MLRSYLTTALRLILRNRFYSFINITGLAIGLTATLLILMYVRDELSYDKFHANKDRIYRIGERFKAGDEFLATGLTPAILAQNLKDHFPQIEKTVRIDYDIETFKVRYNNREFVENNITAVDPDFFDIFSFKVLSGARESFLVEPYTAVISDKIAAKYFDRKDPVGEVMTFVNAYDLSSFEVKITGVFESMPYNSHFHKDILLSAATSEKLFPGREKEWGWTSHFTYIVLAPGHTIPEIEGSLGDFTAQKFSKDFAKVVHFFSQPMTDIHLRSNLKEEFEPNGDIRYVYIFASIAFIILLLACINYMNLATARASRRAREIGIRKVVGAVRSKVMSQFLGESIILSLIALLVSMLLAEIFIVQFNELSGKHLVLNYTDPGIALGSLGIALFTGLVAGAYPAFILSGFKPVEVLRGAAVKIIDRSLLLRKGLVTLQFIISIVLIIGTIVIFTQWNYLQKEKLGLSSDHVVVVPLNTQALRNKYKSIKNQLLRNKDILHVTASNKRLTSRPGNYTGISVAGKVGELSLPIGIIDEDFFRSFGVPVIQGRDFSNEFQADTVNSFIVNEAAVKLLGLSSPVGQKVSAYDVKLGTIVGVVKDFHFESLHTQISPYLFFIRPPRFNSMAIKVKGADIMSSVAEIKSVINQLVPEATFEYSFLDDDIENLYKSEARFFRVFIIFSFLAIFIACLGIYGLISFSASQRTKEIGIRKVLGASVRSISMLLTTDYLKLVLAANILAWPVAYYCMNLWLQSFSYRITMGFWMYLLATGMALLISLITIGFQAVAAARNNPVDSLRND